MKHSKGKIYQYSLDGTFMKEFENTLDVEFKLKIQNATLSHHLCKKSRHCHGFLFTRKYYIRYPIENSYKKPNKIMLNFEKDFFSYDSNGNFLKKFRNLKEVSDKKDVRNWIRACLKGENKTYDNKIWQFEYYEKLPEDLLNKIFINRIYHIDNNGRLVAVYKNVGEASRKTGISDSGIRLVSTGKRNNLNGHRFIKYKEYKNNYGNI